MIRTHYQDELEYLEISNKSAVAKVALQGAHLFHFQVHGEKPLLWLSESSYFKKGKAIRGGVPVCWPWFGAHKMKKNLPNHGFARTSLWEHIKTEEISEYETKVSFLLRNNAQSFELWPFKFELVLEISVSDRLSISLTSKNCDIKAFTLTQALHSYLLVSDISQTYVEGLEQASYYNKVDNSFDNLQEGKLFFAQETDRIYQNIASPLVVFDAERSLRIDTQGAHTVVIWNPGESLAQTMPDLSSHKQMLCVESAQALDEVCLLAPAQSHTLSTSIWQNP